MAGLSDEQMTDVNDAIVVFDKIGDNKVAVEDIVRILRALGKKTSYWLNHFW